MPINRCLLIAVLAVTALLPVASASGATSTTIVVSLKFPAFHGTLQSSKGACKKNRTVKVYREKSGPDTLLATGKSNGKAKWSAPIGNKLISGVYYVKAPRKGTCAPAKSKKIPVD